MKQYRNFKEIQFIWHGEWCDPELLYRNKILNYYDVEDIFYSDYIDLFYNSINKITEDHKERLYNYFLIKYHDNLLGLIDDMIEVSKQ